MAKGGGGLPNLASLDHFVLRKQYAYPKEGGEARIGPLFLLESAAIRHVFNMMKRTPIVLRLGHNVALTRAAGQVHSMKFNGIEFWMPSAEYGGEHGFEHLEGNYVLGVVH